MNMTRFTKMHGIGNDFVMIDDMAESRPDETLPEISRRLCHRKFGIGGDGLILILPAESADFRMRMFNPDGSEPEMCGNGIRCFAKYVFDHGLTDSESITVHTGAGILMLELHVEGNRVDSVRVNMGPPYLQRDQIPIAGAGASPVMGELISIDGREFAITAVSMGNPHAVIFTNDVQQIPLEQIGP